MSLHTRFCEPLMVGPVKIPGRVFLAPMSGVSDAPFRRLAHRRGAGLVFSEMVASEELVKAGDEACRKAGTADVHASDGVYPRVVQLAGRETRWMSEGARIATDLGADIIDINMGCPARRVTNGYSGSALMRDLDHATALVEATVSTTSRPVTLKMRLGWDESSINAPELAKRAECAGVQMITVHGRTRQQFYKGQANWDLVSRVREVTELPLVVNGDIGSLQDARVALAASGADAVMVGRASYGRPWLPGYLDQMLRLGDDRSPPSPEEQLQDLIDLHQDIIQHYGTDIGVRFARKHIAWTLDGLASEISITATQRHAVLTAEDPAFVNDCLFGLIDRPSERRAA